MIIIVRLHKHLLHIVYNVHMEVVYMSNNIPKLPSVYCSVEVMDQSGTVYRPIPQVMDSETVSPVKNTISSQPLCVV